MTWPGGLLDHLLVPHILRSQRLSENDVIYKVNEILIRRNIFRSRLLLKCRPFMVCFEFKTLLCRIPTDWIPREVGTWTCDSNKYWQKISLVSDALLGLGGGLRWRKDRNNVRWIRKWDISIIFQSGWRLRYMTRQCRGVSGGIWTHECEHSRTWVYPLRPLGHTDVDAWLPSQNTQNVAKSSAYQ